MTSVSPILLARFGAAAVAALAINTIFSRAKRSLRILRRRGNAVSRVLAGMVKRKELAGGVVLVSVGGKTVHFEAAGLRDIDAGTPKPCPSQQLYCLHLPIPNSHFPFFRSSRVANGARLAVSHLLDDETHRERSHHETRQKEENQPVRLSQFPSPRAEELTRVSRARGSNLGIDVAHFCAGFAAAHGGVRVRDRGYADTCGHDVRQGPTF
jgi:hypothetical protein